MGENVVHLVAQIFQMLAAGGHLGLVGQLGPPPVEPFVPVLLVVALAAADAEQLFALDLKHPAPHQLVQVAADVPRLAAAVGLGRVLGQHVVVVVAAVQEQKLVAAFGQPFQSLLLLLAAAPQKSEIP